jgi:hypothetical protein
VCSDLHAATGTDERPTDPVESRIRHIMCGAEHRHVDRSVAHHPALVLADHPPRRLG